MSGEGADGGGNGPSSGGGAESSSGGEAGGAETGGESTSAKSSGHYNAFADQIDFADIKSSGTHTTTPSIPKLPSDTLKSTNDAPRLEPSHSQNSELSPAGTIGTKQISAVDTKSAHQAKSFKLPQTPENEKSQNPVGRISIAQDVRPEAGEGIDPGHLKLETDFKDAARDRGDRKGPDHKLSFDITD